MSAVTNSEETDGLDKSLLDSLAKEILAEFNANMGQADKDPTQDIANNLGWVDDFHDSPLDVSFDLFAPSSSASSTLSGNTQSSLSPNNCEPTASTSNQGVTAAQKGFETSFMPANNELGFTVAYQQANGSQNGSGTKHHPPPSQGCPPPSSNGGALGSANGNPEQGHKSAVSLDEQRRKQLESVPELYSQRYWCPDSQCHHARSRPQSWKYFFPAKKDRDEHFHKHKLDCWTPTFTAEFDARLAEHNYSLGIPQRRGFRRGDASVFAYLEKLNREIELCSPCKRFERSAEYTSGAATPESCAAHSHLSYHNWVIHELDKQCGTRYAEGGIRYEARKCAHYSRA